MTESTNQPKPKRRWLRFSLRSFLIVLTIFCVWIGWYLYRVEQQREAVRWVRANGGTVKYDFEYDPQDRYISDPQPHVPKWLLNILDVNYFSSVSYAAISNRQLTDLTPLASLRTLRRLHLEYAPVKDLTPVANLTNLQELWVRQTQVTDVTPLAGLTKLENLYLGGTPVGDEEVQRLQRALPNCAIDQ